jgi:hypothetical protein
LAEIRRKGAAVKQAIISGAVVVILILGSFAHSASKRPLNFQITVTADGEDQEAKKAGFQTRNWNSAHLPREIEGGDSVKPQVKLT